MRKVYLCGNISSDSKTYEWREEATRLLKGDYKTLDPSSNKFNRRLLKAHEGEADEFLQDAIKRSQRILIVKDFNLVESADIILANLQLITPEKPPIGTIFELAWAWLLKKPVIAIVGDNIYCRHPFPTSVFAATANSVEEACTLIKDFFED